MAKVRILGFDPGTANTGYGLIEGVINDIPALTQSNGVIKTTVKDGDVRDRIDAIGDKMRYLISHTKPTHIAIEDFTEQGKRVGTTYKEMAWLLEHMRLVSREMGFEAQIYTNAYWKKVTMGSAHVNKLQIQHFVTHHVTGAGNLLKKQPTHVWDSVAIANCTFTLLKQGEI